MKALARVLHTRAHTHLILRAAYELYLDGRWNIYAYKSSREHNWVDELNDDPIVERVWIEDIIISNINFQNI